jgi:hypothetical protein
MIDLRPLLFPPDSADKGLQYNVGSAQSPFDGSVQTTELPGARWGITLAYKDLNIATGRKLTAIAAMLRGGAQVAHIYDYHYIPRRATEPGAPKINGANQTGTLLAIKGGTPGQGYIMGDQVSYLSTDGMYRMHIVVGDTNFDGAGNMNLPILPPMRNPPVADDNVISVQPSISVTLPAKEVPSASINRMVVAMNFNFIEALHALL